MRRIMIGVAAITLLVAACSVAPLSRQEATWCRAYLTPNQIAVTAQNMDIDIDQAMSEANIAYDMESVIGGDLIDQIDAYWAVMEEDGGYVEVCRALYEENG